MGREACRDGVRQTGCRREFQPHLAADAGPESGLGILRDKGEAECGDPRPGY